MTINERVSPERLAHIRASYEASRKGYAFIGHPSYNESIAIIDELQQYRADAEPARNPVLGYADSYRDMAKRGVESVPIWSVITDLERNIAPLFAAPQVTSVPEEATPESIEVLASVRPPHGVAFQLDGYERKLASDIWNACRGAMLTGEGETAAPPVQAEQLSGNTEQVSHPALPKHSPCVDAPDHIWLQTAGEWPASGEFSELTWSCDNQHPDDTLYVRADLVGNSPAIPDGYALVPVELMESLRSVAHFEKQSYADSFGSHIDTGRWKVEYEELERVCKETDKIMSAVPKKEDE